MEPRDIYVQYDTHEPVFVSTHDEDPSGKLVQRRMMAEDLIKPFVPGASLMVLGTYSVHYGTGDRIPGNFELAQLPLDEGTFGSPLILKCNAVITPRTSTLLASGTIYIDRVLRLVSFVSQRTLIFWVFKSTPEKTSIRSTWRLAGNWLQRQRSRS
jgi:hypothetical protein